MRVTPKNITREELQNIFEAAAAQFTSDARLWEQAKEGTRRALREAGVDATSPDFIAQLAGIQRTVDQFTQQACDARKWADWLATHKLTNADGEGSEYQFKLVSP